jgi:hypothetical protein
LRPEPFDNLIERHCKRAWEEAPCLECRQHAVESLKTVRVSGVPTAAMSSRTRATHLSPGEHSHPAKSSSRSSTTPIPSSASTRSLACSIPSTPPSTRSKLPSNHPLSLKTQIAVQFGSWSTCGVAEARDATHSRSNLPVPAPLSMEKQ